MPLRLHSKPKYVGKGWEREKIKIIALFRSFPTGKGKFQKNSKKIQKIEKFHYGFIPWKNRLENAENGENKNFRYVLFLPDRQEKIPKKIAKKLKN